MRNSSGHSGTKVLFANPFLGGTQEALVIDRNHYLTYLRRADTDSGWQKVPVTSAGFMAAEVVVVVHPRDRTVWAICARGRAEVRALRLVESIGQDGRARCSWHEVPDAIDFRLAREAGSLTRLRVSYQGRIPLVTGVKVGMRSLVTIRPYLGESPFRFLYTDLGGEWSSAAKFAVAGPARYSAPVEASIKIAA
jgi:hypothetical protein